MSTQLEVTTHDTVPQLHLEALHTFRDSVEKPDFLPVPVIPFTTQPELQKIKELSDAHWFEGFQKDDFLRAAQEYLQGSKDKQLYKYFKAVRKPGLIMRTTYRYATTEGGVPKPFHTFLKKLGEFNDAFYSEHGDAALKSVLEAMTGIPDQPYEFTPLTQEQVLQQLHSDIEYILTVCPQDRTETLPVRLFHELRVMLKHIMNLYQLLAFNSGDENIRTCFSYLHTLVSELGDVHDDLVQKTLGNKDAYKQQEAHLSAVQIHKIKASSFRLFQKYRHRFFRNTNNDRLNSVVLTTPQTYSNIRICIQKSLHFTPSC